MRRGQRLHSPLPEERIAAASLHKAIRGPGSTQLTGDALLMMAQDEAAAESVTCFR